MHQIGLLLSQDDNTLEVMLLVEALKTANKLAGRSLYVWRELDPNRPEENWNVDTAVVFGKAGRPGISAQDPAAQLRKLSVTGRRVGSVGQGAFLLAQAGLFSGHKAAVPWDAADCFRELNPQIDIVDSCFIIDRKRFSCCGQLATADLAIRLIEQDHGQVLANQIADALCLDRVRASHEPQGNLRRAGYKSLHPKLAAAITVMEENLETPVSLDWLAQSIELSPRQLQRLFREHLEESPSTYYMRLRLKRARALVEGTDMQISEVAMACGFVSLSHFSRRYRMEFDRVPGRGRHNHPAGAPQPGAPRGAQPGQASAHDWL